VGVGVDVDVDGRVCMCVGDWVGGWLAASSSSAE
jgi:hypothetical protein